MRADDETREAGMRVRREVLGDAHVDRAVERTTDFTAPFQDFITRYAWGEVWSRDGLDRRTRSAVTLAVLTALGREREFAMHVRAALRHGLTEWGCIPRGAPAHRRPTPAFPRPTAPSRSRPRSLTESTGAASGGRRG